MQLIIATIQSSISEKITKLAGIVQSPCLQADEIFEIISELKNTIQQVGKGNILFIKIEKKFADFKEAYLLQKLDESLIDQAYLLQKLNQLQQNPGIGEILQPLLTHQ